MKNLFDRIVDVGAVLDGAGTDWAIGDMLHYAAAGPRATRATGVNVVVPSCDVDTVLSALPLGVAHGLADRPAVLADDQVRLWWGDNLIDVFLASDPIHYSVASRCRSVSFAGHTTPAVVADDLAAFKAMFDRPP